MHNLKSELIIIESSHKHFPHLTYLTVTVTLTDKSVLKSNLPSVEMYSKSYYQDSESVENAN